MTPRASCTVTVTYAGPETYNGEFCYAQSPLGLLALHFYNRRAKAGRGLASGESFRNEAIARAQASGGVAIDIRDPSKIAASIAKFGQQQKITAMIFYEHGSPGQQVLGRDFVRPEHFANTSRYLSKNAYIKFDGCEVAKGEEGRSAMSALAKELGLPVFASSGIGGRERVGRGITSYTIPFVRAWFKFLPEGRIIELGLFKD